MDKHDLLAEFLKTWPIERLRAITLEEYTNLNKQDSFCYWLEQRTNDLGGITGGSSFKFGIYKRNNTSKEITTPNALTDGEYAWFDKYGQTKDEAFSKVRDIVVSIVEATVDKNYDVIESVDFGDATKWKIAFLYSNLTLINTFSKDMIYSILDYFNISYDQGESRLSLSQKVLSQKREDEDFFEFGNRIWGQPLISQELKKLLLKLGNRVIPYFNVLDKIVENFGLEPNNDKYYFNYNKKELVFTIGQRYIWNVSKSIYRYISLNKYEELVEDFKKGTSFPDAYLNSVENINNEILIFDRISQAIPFELNSTSKSGFRSNNKKDFQELIFNREFRIKVLDNLFANGNRRESFIIWLNKKYGEENGTNTSYVRAIDILCELLKVDLYSISKKDYFTELYNDLIENQKDQFGKYYYEKAKSYGEKGFYSAAIQTYITFLSSDIDSINEPTLNYVSMNTKPSLNQILYGPPGTGKTYNTINKAVQIANPDFEVDESLNSNEKRKLIKNEYQRLVDFGQIVFTTFHQSMTYEDFIEGIKPSLFIEKEQTNVIYQIEDGVFKQICNKAKAKELIHDNSINWEQKNYFKLSLGGLNRPDVHEYCFVNELIALGYGGEKDLQNLEQISDWNSFKDAFSKMNPNEFAETKYSAQAAFAFLRMRIGDIVIISKGNHIIDAIGIIESNYFFDDSTKIDYVHFRKVKWLAVNLNAKPDQFVDVNISQMTIYEFYKHNIKFNAFKELFSNTNESNKHSSKPHVLIIDEINRGNVSQIFGELITLIEEDKRLGNDEAIEVTLPYSKEKFGVPSNLYIIGTMNTADRSVEALDTALRRRFVFEEMPPKYDLEGLQQGLYGFKAAEILQTINKRIEKLLDRDHRIGHAYFINKNEITIIDSFYKNIIPLLQEYFFGDYGKIGLVLGAGFVKLVEDDSVFASFNYGDFSQYEERESYEIVNHRDNPIGFREALQFLMN